MLIKVQNNKILKITSILMIVGRTIGLIGGIIAVMGVDVFAAVLVKEANLGLILLGSIFFLASSIISLIAGILGVKNLVTPKNINNCFLLGTIAVIFSIIGFGVILAAGNKFNILNLITGIMLPGLYLYGTFENEKLINTVRL